MPGVMNTGRSMCRAFESVLFGPAARSPGRGGSPRDSASQSIAVLAGRRSVARASQGSSTDAALHRSGTALAAAAAAAACRCAVPCDVPRVIPEDSRLRRFPGHDGGMAGGRVPTPTPSPVGTLRGGPIDVPRRRPFCMTCRRSPQRRRQRFARRGPMNRPRLEEAPRGDVTARAQWRARRSNALAAPIALLPPRRGVRWSGCRRPIGPAPMTS